MKKLLIIALLIMGCEESEPTDCAGIESGDTSVDCAGICGGSATENDEGECGDITGCDLDVNTIYLYNNSEVLYNVDTDIGGFQFDVIGSTVASISGGAAAENGFTVQGASTVIGFSFTGSYIPIGCGLLTELGLPETATGLDNIVFSTPGGIEFEVSYYNSCDGVIDECGICNGEGIDEGTCDCNGNILDECGVCGGNGFDFDEDGVCDDEDDCVGEYDCLGTCNGTEPDSDGDGICDADDTCDGEIDCNGVCDGPSFIDCTDTCGILVFDECGDCGGNGVDADSDGVCDGTDADGNGL